MRRDNVSLPSDSTIVYTATMKFRAFIIVGILLASTAIIWPRDVLAGGRVVLDTFHNAYVGHFIDKATFLVNCL